MTPRFSIFSWLFSDFNGKVLVSHSGITGPPRIHDMARWSKPCLRFFLIVTMKKSSLFGLEITYTWNPFKSWLCFSKALGSPKGTSSHQTSSRWGVERLNHFPSIWLPFAPQLPSTKMKICGVALISIWGFRQCHPNAQVELGNVEKRGWTVVVCCGCWSRSMILYDTISIHITISILTN